MARVSLDQNFRELFASLNSAKVKYLLVGGYAINFHGYSRATDDLDIWIATDPTNARRVSSALQEFGGFAPAAVDPKKFEDPDAMFIMGREPLRIDIMTVVDGIKFDECYKRRVVANWDGVKVPIISLADLKKNKKHSGRAKDLADIAYLPPESDQTRTKTKKPTRRKNR